MNISFGKHHRTIRTNKNIFYSFFIKETNMVVRQQFGIAHCGGFYVFIK
jgi:hypothetical protein